MGRRLFTLFCFLPFIAFSQYHITGKVISIVDKKPVANAGVFLSNASAGTKSNDDGTFEMTNVRSGHYELVVSIVGFTTYRQNVVVNDNLVLGDLQIEPANNMLKEVRIGPDPLRDRNYAIFKREFLGVSDFAKDCKILNPDAVNLHYDAASGELTGNSDDFIEVENRDLGYKVKYLLSIFSFSNGSFGGTSLYFAGSAFFEDLPGKPSQIKKWRENRQKAYLGSDMHFFRSLIANRVELEGFTVRRLIKTPKPDYKKSVNQQFKQNLVNTPLTTDKYLRLTDQKGEYALEFDDSLYINYHKKGETVPATSIVNFAEPHIFFDDNGVIINPSAALFEDAWGLSRVADMLPVDYVPPSVK